MYSHNGVMPGLWSYDAYDPDDDVAIVVLSNADPNVALVAQAAARLVLGTR